MRRGARLALEELAPYLLEVSPRAAGSPCPLDAESAHNHAPDQQEATATSPLAWSSIFGNTNPVEIEVGFGKGLFLVTAGSARPDTNFFGIEIERKYALFTATRLAKRGLPNVKVASCDARWFLAECVPAESVAALHIYFPDPWWKNRHRKRRLLTEPFVAECARVLQKGGRLHLVSDVEDYFAGSTDMIARLGSLMPLPPPEAKSPEHEMDFLTNFERKYRRAGKPIYRGQWQKSKTPTLLHRQWP
jgi:tRNA (guanine-N7-)-methyltransferase